MTNDAPAVDAATDEATQTLAADIVTYPDAPDECTLSPREVTEDQTTTAWITARGDAFVSADEMR